MDSIFISYRREDVAGYAGRICDRLSAQFGGEHVFIDVEDVKPGQDFLTSIAETIGRCTCVLAIIGPRWLDRLHAKSGGDDFVRTEIVTALERGITVVPVLIGTKMPPAQELPPDLASLSYRNALEIRHERFDDDLMRLEEFVGSLLADDAAETRQRRRTRRALWVAAPIVIVATVVAAYLAFPRGSPEIDGAWVAEMQRPGSAPYRIRLRYSVSGENVTGVVSYPTGEGAILEGRLDGRELSYHTSHTPRFESAPVTIEHRAEVLDGNEIRLTVISPAGAADGVARRAGGP